MRHMLMLLLRAQERWFALPAHAVERILQDGALIPLSGMPKAVIGAINFSQGSFPVIDFSYLLTGQPCALSMHTRIIVIGGEEKDQKLCLRAEGVTQAKYIKRDLFIDAHFTRKDAPFLGGIYASTEGVIQLILVDELQKVYVEMVGK